VIGQETLLCAPVNDRVNEEEIR